jgi:hypothetical protein
VAEATALRRSIAAATRGADPTLKWQGPVLCGVQLLKMTLENRQELPNSPRRYVLVTLQAKRRPDQPLSADHVKVLVEMDEGDRTYFAACVWFFVDSADALFVALRWLAEVPGVVVEPDSELMPLKQTPVGATKSYSVYLSRLSPTAPSSSKPMEKCGLACPRGKRPNTLLPTTPTRACDLRVVTYKIDAKIDLQTNVVKM